MDGGAWWAADHGVAKSQTRLSDFTFTFHFHFSLSCIEKEMATHSSVLAWRILGTGEPGGLPSMGSHSQTQLRRLSSSSSSKHIHIIYNVCTIKCNTYQIYILHTHFFFIKCLRRFHSFIVSITIF